MPLKPQRAAKIQRSTLKSQAVPKKTAAKSVEKKPGVAGKKAEKKAPRAKAGYELYSSDSEDHRKGHVNFAKTDRQLRTLVGEWVAKQAVANSVSEHTSNMEMMSCVERHDPIDKTTQFNRRLMSSTPDPDRLLDDHSVDDQLFPERDTDQRPGDEAMSTEPAEASAGEEGAAALLSESERQRVRQQLDAALIEEARMNNKILQDQWKALIKKQQLQVASSVSSSAVTPHDQLPVKRKERSVQKEGFFSSKAASGQRPLTKGGMNKVVTKHGLADQNMPATVNASNTNLPASQSAPAGLHGNINMSLPPTASSWHDIMASGLETRGSDIGVFQHFLNRDSADLPSHLLKKDGGDNAQGFAPYTKDPALHMSMGFTPNKGNQTGPFSQPTSGSSPGSIPTAPYPLTILTDDDSLEKGDSKRPVHVATPACSPVRSSRVPNQPSQNIVRNSPFKNGLTVSLLDQCRSAANQAVQEPPTPASSPERDQVEDGVSAGGGRGQPQHLLVVKSNTVINSPVSGNSHQPNAKRNAHADNYTSDGYYINHSANSGKANAGDSMPSPRQFAPSPHPASTKRPDLSTSGFAFALYNENNNSAAYGAQPNINQNMHNDSLAAPARPQLNDRYFAQNLQDKMKQTYPSREAMADMDFLRLPCSLEEAVMINEVVTDPPALACSFLPRAFFSQEVKNGPRRLRSLIKALKETCAIDGDMEVCRLVQQITDVVEQLPQLKVNFNLQAEIDLALQPARSECGQLKRRLKMVNLQLRERERQEKEGLDPQIQVEILTLQAENMELQKKLMEADASCSKLTAFISKQQQLLQQELAQKEHEELVDRQALQQQMNSLNQQVDKMSLRNQSLQSKLSAADCQNSVHDLNLKQRDMEIVRLQDTLGKMKQAVFEVVEHVSNSKTDVSTIHNLPSFRMLQGMLKSNPPSRLPEYDITATSSRGQLDVSGNRRIVKVPSTGEDKTERITSRTNETTLKSVRDVSHSMGTASAKGPAKVLFRSESGNIAGTEDVSLSIATGIATDKSSSKDSLSTGSIPPSPLTVAAVAAHNQHQETMQTEGDAQPWHSWDGGEHHQSQTVGNGSLPYHSDPESAPFMLGKAETDSHKHHGRIKEWTAKVEGGRPQPDLHHATSETGTSRSKESAENKAETNSETGTVPTLSEFPISDLDSGEPEKLSESPPAADNTRHSITDYFKKYPSSVQTTAVPKSSQQTTGTKSTMPDKADEITTPPPKETPADKKSPPISSPNSSLTCSTSNTTQKDYFQGTELDLSLSTIPEDGLSSVTGLTGASMSTAMSLDDRKFKEGVNALDEKIVQVTESLKVWKKTFA